MRLNVWLIVRLNGLKHEAEYEVECKADVADFEEECESEYEADITLNRLNKKSEYDAEYKNKYVTE